MTDSRGESDDQHTRERPEPIAGQPFPSADARPDTARGGSVPAPPLPARPGAGLGHGSVPASPRPARVRQAGGAKAGFIVASAVGLVVVLGVGIAIGLGVGGNHGSGASAVAMTSSGTASPSSASSVTTTQPYAEPGNYSMSAVNDACDLADTKPLMKWSSKPTPPVHMEDPANSAGGGYLLCQIQYTSTSPVDGVSTDEAGISLEVQFAPGIGQGYDQWKSTDTAPQPGWSSGTITGLGAQGYWHAADTTDPSPGATYIVGMQDSNISVRVQVAVLRAQGEAPLNLDDLKAIAQSQVRMVLVRLKKP